MQSSSMISCFMSEPARRERLAAGMVVILLCFAIYYPALHQETVNYDDPKWIAAASPPGLQTLKEIVTNSPPGRLRDLGYAAPVTASSIMVDLWIGQATGNVQMAHKGVNILLHTCNAVLVLILMGRLSFQAWVCLMVSAIFAAHPLQVSSVAWLAERKNLLMTLFFLLAILSYLSYRRDAKLRSYVLCLVAYVFSLLSKPSAVTLGPCLLLTDICMLDKGFTKRALLRVIPFLVLAVVWVVISARSEGPVPHEVPLLDVILLLPYKIVFLLGKFFMPIGLCLVYPALQMDSAQAIMWGLWGLLVVVGILLWYLHRAVPLWEVLWGAGFYGINLMPTSGFVQWKGMKELYVADHYQYTAMIGLAAATALGLARLVEAAGLKNPGHAKALVSCGVLLPLAFAASSDLRVWQNSGTLWLKVMKENPGSYTARYNYGHYLQAQERIDEAVEQYHHAIFIGGDRVHQAYFNLGGILLANDRIDEAREAFDAALLSNPRFWEAHASLANLYYKKGEYNKALEHCLKTVTLGGACSPSAIKKAMEQPPPRP